eukprot:TRINITY_DN3581_c0_g1_i10.p1 TRINITY_DN3581_c0_g1~~TRINITY_DN3581_c0_g1_i10.p1  ORF type:complete len:1447 (-),score=372.82 TRINITY_DN3581_c0_g1_i10:28-4368(-)
MCIRDRKKHASGRRAAWVLQARIHPVEIKRILTLVAGRVVASTLPELLDFKLAPLQPHCNKRHPTKDCYALLAASEHNTTICGVRPAAAIKPGFTFYATLALSKNSSLPTLFAMRVPLPGQKLQPSPANPKAHKFKFLCSLANLPAHGDGNLDQFGRSPASMLGHGPVKPMLAFGEPLAKARGSKLVYEMRFDSFALISRLAARSIPKVRRDIKNVSTAVAGPMAVLGKSFAKLGLEIKFKARTTNATHKYVAITGENREKTFQSLMIVDRAFTNNHTSIGMLAVMRTHSFGLVLESILGRNPIENHPLFSNVHVMAQVGSQEFKLPEGETVPAPFGYKRTVPKGLCFFGKLGMPEGERCHSNAVCNMVQRAIIGNQSLSLTGCLSNSTHEGGRSLSMEVPLKNIVFNPSMTLLNTHLTYTLNLNQTGPLEFGSTSSSLELKMLAPTVFTGQLYPGPNRTLGLSFLHKDPIPLLPNFFTLYNLLLTAEVSTAHQKHNSTSPVLFKKLLVNESLLAGGVCIGSEGKCRDLSKWGSGTQLKKRRPKKHHHKRKRKHKRKHKHKRKRAASKTMEEIQFVGHNQVGTWDKYGQGVQAFTQEQEQQQVLLEQLKHEQERITSLELEIRREDTQIKQYSTGRMLLSTATHWSMSVHTGHCQMKGGEKASDEQLETITGVTLSGCKDALQSAHNKERGILRAEYSGDSRMTCFVISSNQSSQYIATGSNTAKCISMESTAVQPPSVSHVAVGWCKGGVIKRSKAPRCERECALMPSCAAVRWQVETKRCDLLSVCSAPNKDWKWKHVRITSVVTLPGGCEGRVLDVGAYPQCISDCANTPACTAVQWIVSNHTCELLDKCAISKKHIIHRRPPAHNPYLVKKFKDQPLIKDKAYLANPSLHPTPHHVVWKHALVTGPYNHVPTKAKVGLGDVTKDGSAVRILTPGGTGAAIRAQMQPKIVMGKMKGGAIAGKAYLSPSTNKDSPYLMYAAISRVTLYDLEDAFEAGSMALPRWFGAAGIEPFNQTACALQKGGAQCFAYLSYNPGKHTIVTAMSPALRVPRGVAAVGSIQLLGASTRFNMSISTKNSSMHMNLEGTPFTWLKQRIQVCRAQHHCDHGPRMRMNAWLKSRKFTCQVDKAWGRFGEIVSGQVFTDVTHAGVSFALAGVEVYRSALKASLVSVKIDPYKPKMMKVEGTLQSANISVQLRKKCESALQEINKLKVSVVKAQAVLLTAYDRAKKQLAKAPMNRALQKKVNKAANAVQTARLSVRLALQKAAQVKEVLVHYTLNSVKFKPKGFRRSVSLSFSITQQHNPPPALHQTWTKTACKTRSFWHQGRPRDAITHTAVAVVTEAKGSCGAAATVLTTGTYPKCVKQCKESSFCAAAQWHTVNKSCDLLASCDKPAPSAGMKHSIVHRPVITSYPACRTSCASNGACVGFLVNPARCCPSQRLISP